MQTVLQITVAVFTLFAISRVYLRFKERKLSSFAFIFWVFVWIAGVVSIFQPDLTSKIANIVGIGRGVDVVLYASIVILFYLIFRIYIKVEDTHREITELARKIALKPAIKRKKTKP